MNGEPAEGLHAETLETNPDQIPLTPLVHHAAFLQRSCGRTADAAAASGNRLLHFINPNPDFQLA